MKFARAPPPAAEQLGSPVGQHFIHVHVRLGTRPCLPDNQGEFSIVAAGDDFIGSLDDGRSDIGIEQPQVAIYARAARLINASA